MAKMMAWKLATRPVTATSASAPAALAEDGAETVEQRLAGGAERKGAVHGGGGAGRIGDLTRDRDRRVEEQHEKAEHDQREHAEHDALRHVALGIDEFFGGERQLLDGEEQPHREGQRRQHAVDAERQERAVALGQLDRRSGGGIGADIQGVFAEVEQRDGADEKHDAGQRAPAG